MTTQSEKEARKSRQLELLLNAEQVRSLDARSRAAVVRLLAKLLREAATCAHGRPVRNET